MKKVLVYGIGCKNCKTTMDKINEYAEKHNIEVEVSKVTDMVEIMNAGVMSTPGVSIDGTIVHTGSVPTEDNIEAFLK